MAKLATMALTLRHLVDQGIECDPVERFVRTDRGGGPPRGFRKDWLGFADIIGFDREYLYVVQATDQTDVSKRRNKILETAAARDLVTVSQLVPRILVYGWKEQQVGRKKVAVPQITIVGLGDFLDKDAKDRVGSG